MVRLPQCVFITLLCGDFGQWAAVKNDKHRIQPIKRCFTNRKSLIYPNSFFLFWECILAICTCVAAVTFIHRDCYGGSCPVLFCYMKLPTRSVDHDLCYEILLFPKCVFFFWGRGELWLPQEVSSSITHEKVRHTQQLTPKQSVGICHHYGRVNMGKSPL